MISQTAEYALRAVVHLARIGGGPAVTEEIAEATMVPKGYLARILRDLSKAGILTARRGIGGGFALAIPAGKISLWDVLDACDGNVGRIVGCPLGISSHDSSLCSLHQLLDDTIAEVERRFKTATIQDVLTADHPSKPLCQASEQVDLKIEGQEPGSE